MSSSSAGAPGLEVDTSILYSLPDFMMGSPYAYGVTIDSTRSSAAARHNFGYSGIACRYIHPYFALRFNGATVLLCESAKL